MSTTPQVSSVQLQRAKLLKRATLTSVCVAILLICVKMAAWLITGSVSILASLVDSLTDSIASMVNLIAVRYSLTPADSEHRFGHGKAEPLAALVQAGFICGSAVFLVLYAIDNLRFAHPLKELDIGVMVMIFASVATGLLVLYQRRIIKQTQSTAIQADALHYSMDFFTNVGTIIALLLVNLGWTSSDSLFAIGLAVYIFYSATTIGHDAFQQLMDRELDIDIQNKLQNIALEHSEVKGVHDLRTRQSGHIKFVQIHLELDDMLSLLEAHTIADQVESAIYAAFPDAEVIVHLDPASIRETKTT